MKKHFKYDKAELTIILATVLFFVAAIAFAQTFHTANQKTIAWDAVTQTTGGAAIDPAEMSYNVYLANALTDPNKTNPSLIGNTADLQYLVTLGVEGQYFVGVKAVRTVGGEVVSESTISWSDAATPDFGLRYYEPPQQPGGLNIPG